MDRNVDIRILAHRLVDDAAGVHDVWGEPSAWTDEVRAAIVATISDVAAQAVEFAHGD